MSTSNINTDVLVVGGGISGLTAAWELAQKGRAVLVVEKGLFIGGYSAHLSCKATDRCLKCNDCLVEERLRDISREGTFNIRTVTEITAIEKGENRFHASLKSDPILIDPDRCTNCGLCYEKCRELGKGAVIRAPSHHIHPFYAIDPSKCTCLKGGEPPPCQAICPEKAVTFAGKGQSWSVEAEGVLLAIGYEPFDPEKIERFSFRNFKNMITAMELEKMLRNGGRIARVSDSALPRNVAFIQCVGSRDSRLNHEFCSRVCCGYALRMGLNLVYNTPDLEITVFYMDIQNFGKDFSRYVEEAHTRMRLIRGLPGDFYGAGNDRISLSFYDEKSGKTITEDFDMVVLSVGIMPSPSNVFFNKSLGCSTNRDGFLSLSQTVKNSGIVLAGTVEGPMDVSESITHAKRAALEMNRFLNRDFK